jgi:hypothetical protein
MRLQPVACGVWSVFSRATIKVFLAFYITSSAKLDGGPFNDLKLHFTTWQYTDGQHHSCYRVSHPKGSSRQASAKFLVCPTWLWILVKGCRP